MVAFTAGAVLTAANLNTAFNALTFRAVTGTSDTFVLADNGGAVSYSNASPITATVPPFSSVAYANGTVIQLLNLGAGVVTVTAGVGVTLNGSSVAIAQNAGGTLIKTATNTWYFLPSASAPGMDLITPTSVAGTGVTLSGGQVSFSAATAISVNGCFSATYDNYLIRLKITGSTTTSLNYRMRSAGTDNSGAIYQAQLMYGNGASAAGSAAISQTSGRFGSITSTDMIHMSIDAFSPFLAEATLFYALAGYRSATTSPQVEAQSGGHASAVSYDGITMLPLAGNATGNLRIYGLRNS